MVIKNKINRIVNTGNKTADHQQHRMYWVLRVMYGGKGARHPQWCITPNLWWHLTFIGTEVQCARVANILCPEVFYNLYYNSFEQIQVIYDMVWYRCHSHILFDLGDDCDTFLLLVSLMYVIVMSFFGYIWHSPQGANGISECIIMYSCGFCLPNKHIFYKNTSNIE